MLELRLHSAGFRVIVAQIRQPASLGSQPRFADRSGRHKVHFSQELHAHIDPFLLQFLVFRGFGHHHDHFHKVTLVDAQEIQIVHSVVRLPHDHHTGAQSGVSVSDFHGGIHIREGFFQHGEGFVVQVVHPFHFCVCFVIRDRELQNRLVGILGSHEGNHLIAGGFDRPDGIAVGHSALQREGAVDIDHAQIRLAILHNRGVQRLFRRLFAGFARKRFVQVTHITCLLIFHHQPVRGFLDHGQRLLGRIVGHRRSALAGRPAQEHKSRNAGGFRHDLIGFDCFGSVEFLGDLLKGIRRHCHFLGHRRGDQRPNREQQDHQQRNHPFFHGILPPIILLIII